MSLSRRVLSAIEAMLVAIEPGSCLAKAEGREQAHDQLQRALNEKLDWLGRTSLYLLGLLSGREGGYLVFDDTIIERSGPGKLGLPKLRTSQGQYCFGLGVVRLMWTNGSIRIPLNLRLRFGETSKQDLALELLSWAHSSGLKPDYVLLDSWYSSANILQIHGCRWSFVTRLKKGCWRVAS